ncbi:MAG: pyridoxal-phosphate dependent enzyme, partial [Hyphomicrobiales bacterium]|nr:pyridoxal-phosphate dependent enzyme [Hyphomicrobiales bacterium]
TLPVLPVLGGIFVLGGLLSLRKSIHFFVLHLLALTMLYLIAGVMGYGWYVMEIATLFFAMGLIAGIALYIKSLSPETKIIGVEPEDAASMAAAIKAGKPVTLNDVGIFADGVAVRRVGDETFRICQELVDDIIIVDNDEICAAIQDIFEDTRAIVEPAGALSVAGLKRYVATSGATGQTLVTVNCGANVNFDRLRHIAERAALGEQREALFAVEIPERQGSFMAFCKAIGKRNITEFNYRLQDADAAQIYVGVEL